ncbi:MAG: wax ester/triacylglycerol synthase family O-acyltransferase [Myxococcota bacterium]|nr:wax ester/triacylglycerol synthase family O-acyltransferase [Myxococcota bacterium]
MAGRSRTPKPRPLELAPRMAPSDALFWYAEEALPQFRATIAGLYVLDGTPDPARLDVALDRAIALVPRLRQRVLDVPLHLGLPEWVDDPHFDRRYHLRHVSLAPPGDWRHLLDLAATLFATPFDRERPMWEATWIEGLEGGRSAYLFKMHHSMVDGVGSLAILHAITQAARDEAPRRMRRAKPAPLPGVGEQLTRLTRDNARDALALARRGVDGALEALRRPAEALEDAGRTWRGVRAMVADALQPAVRDPLSVDSAGISRRFDVLDVPIERLRKLKAPLGATINDVVLAALAGALGAYYRKRGHRLESLKCMVPMNLRGRGDRDTMGNRVGMFNVWLPLDERSAARRLQRIQEQTRAAKEDQRGAAGPLFVEALTALPGGAFRWLARQAVGQVNVSCTNVPGSPERRYMAGAAVEAVYPFASVVEGTPLVMALLSYAGTMNIGIDTDPEAIPDPHRIAELFEQQLAELEALA